MDQLLLGEVDLELALIVALHLETALVLFVFSVTEGGWGGVADAAHRIQELSYNIQCSRGRMVNYRNRTRMIRKQTDSGKARVEKGQEVRVLTELQDTIKREVNGVREMRRKVDERRMIERNQPQVESLVVCRSDEESKVLSLLRQKQKQYAGLKSAIVERSHKAKTVQNQIDELKGITSKQDERFLQVLSQKENIKASQQRLLDQIEAINGQIKQASLDKVQVLRLKRDPSVVTSTLNSQKRPLLAQISKMEQTHKTLIAACRQFIQ